MKLLYAILLLILNTSVYSQIYYYHLFDEHIRDTSENFFKVDSAHYYFWHYSTDWQLERKYYVNEKNELGYMTNAEEWHLDEYQGDWFLSCQYSTDYFEDGTLKEYKKLLWFQDSADWVMDEYQLKNDKNQLLDYYSKFWYPIPMACSGLRWKYQYNDFDSVSEYTFQNWQLFTDWFDVNKTSYIYDTSHFLFEKIYYYNWNDSIQIWNNKTKWNYYYENNLNNMCMIYSWNGNENRWEINCKRLHHFDDSSRLDQITYMRMKPDSSWYYSSRRTYVYNNYNKIISRSENIYDTIIQSWIPDYLCSWEFENDSIITIFKRIHWRTDTGIWVNVNKLLYNYDNYQNLSYILYQQGLWSDWRNYRQYDFNYNELGQHIYWDEDHWKIGIDTGYWQHYQREDYFYDINVYISDNYNKLGAFMVLYPNPTSNQLNVQFLNNNFGSYIILLNSKGELLKSEFTDHQQLCIDLSGYPSGLYILNCRQGKHIETYKIIKK
jgi:hypothetical protein